MPVLFDTRQWGSSLSTCKKQGQITTGDCAKHCAELLLGHATASIGVLVKTKYTAATAAVVHVHQIAG